MRHLVRAIVKPGREKALTQAIGSKTLGKGSIAEGEYLRDMNQARQLENGTVCWVEVCYCPVPLQEERPYWEEYFELIQIKNAHARTECRDLNGSEPWACSNCDCTQRLEERMENCGESFLAKLRTPGALEDLTCG